MPHSGLLNSAMIWWEEGMVVGKIRSVPALSPAWINSSSNTVVNGSPVTLARCVHRLLSSSQRTQHCYRELH